MSELFTSIEFIIGLGTLAIIHIANEIYPMISTRGMYIVAIGLALITWLSYRGFL